MFVFENILLVLGGITLFSMGLNFMSKNMELLTGEKIKLLLNQCTKNKYLGVMTGAFTTAIIQSSIATNVIVIGFVSNNIISFYNASAIIMGSNIGTTMTAQLVALSGKDFFNVTAVGSLVAFLGFILSLIKKKNCQEIGGVMMGFGMLFLGLEIISERVSYFKNFEAFRSIFLVKNPLALILNGIIFTAIIQSSSVVTSVMIVLASNGLINFENSMFLILGVNIGNCLAVILSAVDKSVDAKRTAYFNFAFNLLGSIILFVPILLFKTQIATAFLNFSGTIEREIANFHTLFNLLITIVLLPVLKPFTNLICKIIPDKDKKYNKKVKTNTKKYGKYVGLATKNN